MDSVLSIVIGIAVIFVGFKLTWFVLKLFGKLIGLLLSIAGFVILGAIVVGLGVSLLFLPIIAIAGVISIVTGLLRL